MAVKAREVMDELMALLPGLCEQAVLELSGTTALDEIPGLDSMRTMQAVALLEEHFNVEIEVPELDKLYCVQDIVDAIVSANSLD